MYVEIKKLPYIFKDETKQKKADLTKKKSKSNQRMTRKEKKRKYIQILL